MILIIDNYDSFVHNLARYVRQICDEEIRVVRNDEIETAEVQRLSPAAIIISPGPCRPCDSGNILNIIKSCNTLPMFGVCLGHQAILEAFDGAIVRSEKPTHGKPDQIFHDQNHPLLQKIPSPFVAGRYHSLIADANTIPDQFEVIARNDEDIVMAIAHDSLPMFGVQFHPESVLTEHGYQLLHNFLTIAGVASKLDSVQVSI